MIEEYKDSYMYLDSHANSHGRIKHAEENPIETWSSKGSCAW